MLTRRHMEVATGLGLAAYGAVVCYGSLEHGIGWADNGPTAGYFPFRIGALIVALGFGIAARYATIGAHRRPPALAAADASNPSHTRIDFDHGFLDPGALGRIASVFVPTAIAAALIPWLGLYIAAVLFLVFSMRTLGHVPLWKGALIAVVLMTVFYVIFEFWFQVPIEKGILMPLVGLY